MGEGEGGTCGEGEKEGIEGGERRCGEGGGEGLGKRG